MKNKKNEPLNFTNVCNIRAYLSIAIQTELKDRKKSMAYWGASSPIVHGYTNRVRDMIKAYRASKNIQIVA